MTDTELLTEVKKRIGVTGDYQDDTLMGHIQDVRDFMLDAGVSDLWDYGSGNGEFSPYFFQRVTQLAYKGGDGNERL